ncbi:FAD-binding oxidoreductase [Candidatus Sumerlaeota bacterium]|nr:FAD-binding oxidoreductase [Candidatus Sumerlaeota bacterium]MBI3736806.1 FAD-binding oxidoreductase [Candidatus Sumerlaeota bacterium]
MANGIPTPASEPTEVKPTATIQAIHTHRTGSAAPYAEPGLHLGIRNFARVEGWGMAVHSYSYVYQPTDIEGIREVFDLARRTGKKIALRGAGCSYGDASTNQEGIILDLSRMNRILDWNPETGIINLEPGVTLCQLWQSTIADAYWPPVVSGTMFTTVGGCAAMNIHGKNNFKAGPFGNHVLEFDILLPAGEVKTCNRQINSGLFHAAISGFGMLGCFTRIQLKMKKIYSGLLRVEAFEANNLRHMIAEFEERHLDSDYLVGWVDCLAGGKKIGRGLIHQAFYPHEGEDPRPMDHMNVTDQGLPDKFFGIIPKSMMYLLMSPFTNNIGVRLVNAAKFWSRWLQPRGHRYFQSHAAFAFLLDYIPNWKWAYKPGGLIQYQAFIPKANAAAGFENILRVSKKAGLPPYLGVFKKHQPDPFLLSHAVDGYSLALDYRVTKSNRERLWKLTHELDEIVIEAGGRFYFAKDATLTEDRINRFFPRENIETFAALKKECDPENLLQTDLSRRLFNSLLHQA